MKYFIILFALIGLTSCDKELDLASKYNTPNNSTDSEEEQGTGIWNEYRMSKTFTIDQTGIDMEGFWPDGKLCVIPASTPGKFLCFWGEKYSYRTEASSASIENHVKQVTEDNRVFGRNMNHVDGFYDGGAWFIGINRLSDNKLVGFFHAESHWGMQSGAYKSIGVTYSEDEGKTWSQGKKIITADYSKPTTAAWCGLGDGCVVYNSVKKQYICYYSAKTKGDYRICMAASNDIEGKPGTWKKWNGTEFTVEGCNPNTELGGEDTSIEALSNITGANPSVLWNSFLKKWIMVYASWSGSIYMSASDDGLTWATPIKAFENASKVTYPNLIGINGDSEANNTVRLYYGDSQKEDGTRKLAYRTIEY